MRLVRVVALMIVASGCSKQVAFQGTTPIGVAANAPPPVAVAPPPRVEVRDNKIEIHDKIQFDYDKATIKEASFGLMNEIVAVISKNPQIKRIRIEGHASSEGDAGHNRKLSDDRAASVLDYLTKHGVPAAELASKGYGADKPIADNGTEEGREQNRRVEFTILEQDVTKKQVEVDAKTGAEKVVHEDHETVKAQDDKGGTQ